MIEYLARPETLDGALSELGEPSTGVVAGGTDFVVQVRRRTRAWPKRLVTLDRVDDLLGIEENGGGLRIGSRATHADLIESAELAAAATAIADGSTLVGSPATRSAGTIGGNLCNASPAMDLGSPLLVLDAEVEIASANGSRRLPVADLFRGPGRTALEPSELVVAVRLPAPPEGTTASAYVRLGYRNAMEIAVVGAAAYLRRGEDGTCIDARIALTAVAPTCVRAADVKRALIGAELDDRTLAEAAAHAASVGSPIDDIRGSARYRRAMLPVVTRRALALARKRLDRKDLP